MNFEIPPTSYITKIRYFDRFSLLAFIHHDGFTLLKIDKKGQGKPEVYSYIKPSMRVASPEVLIFYEATFKFDSKDAISIKIAMEYSFMEVPGLKKAIFLKIFQCSMDGVLNCIERPLIPLDNPSIKIIFVQSKLLLEQKKLNYFKEVNQDEAVISPITYRFDAEVYSVDFFSSSWIGFTEDSIYTMVINQENSFEKRELIFSCSGNIISYNKTENFLVVNFRDGPEENKTMVFSVQNRGYFEDFNWLTFNMEDFQETIRIFYEWNGYLVAINSRRAAIFRPLGISEWIEGKNMIYKELNYWKDQDLKDGSSLFLAYFDGDFIEDALRLVFRNNTADGPTDLEGPFYETNTTIAPISLNCSKSNETKIIGKSVNFTIFYEQEGKNMSRRCEFEFVKSEEKMEWNLIATLILCLVLLLLLIQYVKMSIKRISKRREKFKDVIKEILKNVQSREDLEFLVNRGVVEGVSFDQNTDSISLAPDSRNNTQFGSMHSYESFDGMKNNVRYHH